MSRTSRYIGVCPGKLIGRRIGEVGLICTEGGYGGMGVGEAAT